MITFDQATVDSSGAFLIGELERLDQTLNLPLVGYTWTRDIQLREDVSIADDISSWTNTSFAAAGTGANPNGKNWVGKDSTAIAGVNVDIGKSGNPLNLWGMELGWTVIELQAAQQVGRPIDTQKYDGMQLKWQMDIRSSLTTASWVRLSQCTKKPFRTLMAFNSHMAPWRGH